MAINRFYRRQLRNQYVPMSFEEVSLIPRMKAQAHSQMMQGAEAMRVDINALPWDRETESTLEKQNAENIDQFINTINQYGVDKIAPRDISQFSNQQRGHLKKLSGLQNNAQSYAKMMEEYDEVAKKDSSKTNWVQFQKNWLYNMNRAMPTTFDEAGNASSIFSADYVDDYTPEEILKEVQQIELDIEDLGGGIPQFAGSYADTAVFVVASGKVKFRDPLKIMAYLNQLSGSPKMLAYMQRLKDMNPNMITGLESLDGPGKEHYTITETKDDKTITKFNTKTALGSLLNTALADASVMEQDLDYSHFTIRDYSKTSGGGGGTVTEYKNPLLASTSGTDPTTPTNTSILDAINTDIVNLNEQANEAKQNAESSLNMLRTTLSTDYSNLVLTSGLNLENVVLSAFRTASQELGGIVQGPAFNKAVADALTKLGVPGEYATSLSTDGNLFQKTRSYINNLKKQEEAISMAAIPSSLQQTIMNEVREVDPTYEKRYAEFESLANEMALEMLTTAYLDPNLQGSEEAIKILGAPDAQKQLAQALLRYIPVALAATTDGRDGIAGMTFTEVRDAMNQYSPPDPNNPVLYNSPIWNLVTGKNDGASFLGTKGRQFLDLFIKASTSGPIFQGNDIFKPGMAKTAWLDFENKWRRRVEEFVDDTPEAAINVLGQEIQVQPGVVKFDFDNTTPQGKQMAMFINQIRFNMSKDGMVDKFQTADGHTVRDVAAEQLDVRESKLYFDKADIHLVTTWNPRNMTLTTQAAVGGTATFRTEIQGARDRDMPLKKSIPFASSEFGQRNIDNIMEWAAKREVESGTAQSDKAGSEALMHHGYRMLKEGLGSGADGLSSLLMDMNNADSYNFNRTLNIRGVSVRIGKSVAMSPNKPYIVNFGNGTGDQTYSSIPQMIMGIGAEIARYDLISGFGYGGGSIIQQTQFY